LLSAIESAREDRANFGKDRGFWRKKAAIDKSGHIIFVCGKLHVLKLFFPLLAALKSDALLSKTALPGIGPIARKYMPGRVKMRFLNRGKQEGTDTGYAEGGYSSCVHNNKKSLFFS